MAGSAAISSILLLLLITDVRTQFFNFDIFNIPPIPPTTKYTFNDHTTRRTKVNTVRTTDPNTQIQWKNTSIAYIYEDIDRDERIPAIREKKRKQTTPAPSIDPILNFFMTTTHRPTRKHKVSSTRKTTTSSNNNSNESKRKINNNVRLSYELDTPKNHGMNNIHVNSENSADYYTKPYETTSKSYEYNNNNYYNNDFTTKNPFLNRPGVKPAVTEHMLPITNKPPTRRPIATTHYPVPSTGNTNPKITPRPYIINPIPTDAGAVVYPHDNDEPEIIKGVDEDNMSDTEKRRYIEMAERMCDNYKSLNTKQLSAIPLLPSPEPVSVNVSQCSPLNVPLVIGGKVVSIKDFPHAALLGWEKIDGGGYSWKCGGSLISDQWVLTAGHCSYEERDNTVLTGPPRVVQLGSSYLDDPGALVVRVGSVVRHPKYKFPRSYYDIALLKLVQPVKFSEVIKPACLGVPPAVRDPVIVAGWGKTQLGGNLSLELRAVSIPVWDLGRCREVLGTSRKMPEGPMGDSQLCAGDERGGKDTCQGDSGGPTQIQDGCIWRVVAVTSLGRSCGAPNTPGLYAIAKRAFISATVFGGQKNNNRRPVNNQGNNNRENDNSNVNSNIHRDGYSGINNNDKRQNDYSNVNSNNGHRQNEYPNENHSTNHRQNDNSNFNSDSNHRDNHYPGVITNDNNRPNNYPNVNSNENHGHNDYNVNSNNNRRNNEYSNVNKNDNNYRPNEYQNVNNNNGNRQKDYPVINSDDNSRPLNFNRNTNERRAVDNVNIQNNQRRNDYSTTKLFSNTRQTSTATESYNNQDYNNRNRGQTDYNQNENRRDSYDDRYGNDKQYNTQNSNNKRNYDSGYHNEEYGQNTQSSPSSNRQTDSDSIYRNQDRGFNHNSNNRRRNNNNQNSGGHQRPTITYYGGIDEAPIWWT